MGRKGRGGSAKAKLPSICFYCMREFQDETTLVAHQQVRRQAVACARRAAPPALQRSAHGAPLGPNAPLPFGMAHRP